MIDRAMKRSGASAAKITTVKSAVALSVILAALILPQIVHAAAGASGGATWLPMYIPVILGGALLGPVWGLAVGISSPVVSFLITSALGSPMPVLTRLPYMIVELAVFAAVTGLFSKAILKNKALAFPAVIAAAIAGRGVFLLTALLFESVSPISFAAALAQVESGIYGVVLQVVVLPFVIAGIAYLMSREGKRSE